MKLSTFVLGLVAVAGLSGAGGVVWRVHARSAEWRKLISCAGTKSCMPRDQWEEFFDIARRAVPNEPAGAVVLRSIVAGPAGPQRRILILVEDAAHPGEVRVHRFNEDRDHLGMTALATGKLVGPVSWQGAGSLESVLDGPFVLEVAQTEYHDYALYKEEPVLLGIDDIYGKVPSNNYVDPGLRIGPPLPPDALSRCEAMLISSKPVEILQALTWLHGRHAEGSGWSELRKRPSVERRIQELAAMNATGITKAAKALLPTENAAAQSDR